MGRVRVVTDSTACIPPELAARHEIEVLPLHLAFADRDYEDGMTADASEFYELLRAAKEPPTPDSLERRRNRIQMNGRETYRFAVATFVDLTRDTLEKVGWTPDELTLLVPHQVNLRIIESAEPM